MQYIGFDIHKRYTFYTQMDANGQIQRQGKLANTREGMEECFAAVAEPARVVLEASMNWYHLYDLLEALEIPVTLAHPLRTRAIAEAKVKTDKVDSTILLDQDDLDGLVLAGQTAEEIDRRETSDSE